MAKAEDFLDDEANEKKRKKEMQEKKADEEALFFLKTQFIQDRDTNQSDFQY